jgi:hypothetical protein
MLTSSQERGAIGENHCACPIAIVIHAIDQVARRAAQHARGQREVH